MASEDRELFQYYLRELTYLREMGEVFAHRHPKVARRLELGPDGSADPHVERLLEGFALLTGRIQQNLDNDFPEIASELLQILYPHYLNPIPPMTIARFETDPTQGKVTAGQLVPKGTRVFAPQGEGMICRFRTCYPTTLWPLTVEEATFESPARWDGPAFERAATVLRLRLRGEAGSLKDLELDTLRFFLYGNASQVSVLYELLFIHALAVAVEADPDVPLEEGEERTVRWLRDGRGDFQKPRPVGFEVDDEVLPYPPTAHPAYRLVQEYFLFPEKFHFFDVEGLTELGAEGCFDLLILCEALPEEQVVVDRDTFRLGCTPIVNLFERTSEPIRLDQKKFEYRLVGDYHRERTTEIHSILDVQGSVERGQMQRQFMPFYSFDHGQRDGGAFWHARRVASRHKNVVGTDMLLSFVDLDFEPTQPAVETVFARCLCTNRDLATQVPAGGALQSDLPGLSVPIECLYKPTPPLEAPRDGQTLWRLVSHLSLNELSLGGEQGVEALREILRLYSVLDAPATERQILGIRHLESERVVRRFGPRSWTGFCRGMQVTLTLERNQFKGASAYLLAAVLSRFFALHASINTFTELVVKRTDRKEPWTRWAPRAGEQELI